MLKMGEGFNVMIQEAREKHIISMKLYRRKSTVTFADTVCVFCLCVGVYGHPNAKKGCKNVPLSMNLPVTLD